MRHVILMALAIFSFPMLYSQAWIPDLGDGNYKNPVIHADYSDPDVVRVGKDFYMVSSSFNCVPGLPVLHSTDLINWRIINHVFDHMPPDEMFSKPQHGNGCWAPSLRYHEGTFYIFFGDPDQGIFMSKTTDPAAKWSELELIHEGKGWIDPCPLWDENGKAYLVHAFAGSRSGMKSILVVHRMKSDATGLLDKGVMIYDGHGVNPTIEGPKFYKKNGFYYIFAPAGGVKPGWQTVLRSTDPFGPYEIRTVMHQGSTEINGPHQGGWVELENGEYWFMHFQDKDAYGRVVHLNPMFWKDDWPVIGSDPDGDGTGEPLSVYTKPSVESTSPAVVPQTSDEFNGTHHGLQWQWHANPRQEWMFMSGHLGFIRLYCILADQGRPNLWNTPNLFLQKFPAPGFTALTKLSFKNSLDGDQAGLMIMGMDYAYLSICQEDNHLLIKQVICADAMGGSEEKVMEAFDVNTGEIYLKVEVSDGGNCRFSYSSDGEKYHIMKQEFKALPGRWIGAKVGLFAESREGTNDKGYVDVDWFRIK